jgi:hypothetical protein
LATWIGAGGGTRVDFEERLTDEPFSKMGMLAAILIVG